MSAHTTSYLLRVSTRRLGKLIEQLGIKHISKSQVSQMAKTLDEQVEAFRTRALACTPSSGRPPSHRRCARAAASSNVHVLVVTGVNADGRRARICLPSGRDYRWARRGFCRQDVKAAVV
ncbi:transposase [Nonomuraea sp. NPDC003707]